MSHPVLPTSGQLVRSTLLALVLAATLLITCVLPAEYGIDITGVGRPLGLTAMGEYKRAALAEAEMRAAAEAEADSVQRDAEAGGR